MSRVWFTSDLHLGHKGVCRFREKFNSDEEHHNTLYESLVTSVGKRDILYLLGDIAFSKEWLDKIGEIKCQKKILVMGNHDQQKGYDVTIQDIVNTYDSVLSLVTYKGYWITHCPIHPDEIRNRKGVIAGHTHFYNINDPRYFNVCPENTNWRPILFSEIVERMNSEG